MPTLLLKDGFRVYFYSHEPNEPPHVHVDHSGSSAKVWLHDCSVARNVGFTAKDLGRVVQLVREHREAFVEAWNGFFGV